MSTIDKVRGYLAQYGEDKNIREFSASSATVPLAALALGVEEARIAKSLALDAGGDTLIVVCAGRARIDNSKYKAFFGTKARMLSPSDTLSRVGHEVGGVCPFAVKTGVRVYLDQSLQRFSTVFPACGSANSAIELTPDRLFELGRAIQWVDVCKL